MEIYNAGNKILILSSLKFLISLINLIYFRYPAPAVFYRDRLEYTFHHPFQSAEIHLILYYRDMQGLTLSPNPQPGKIHFRVPRKLVHFASDYDPTKHYVTLYLSSSLALENIRNEILPLVPGRNSSIGSTLAKLT